MTRYEADLFISIRNELKAIYEELRSLKILIILHKDKKVKTIENVKDIDILDGLNGQQNMFFDEYSLNNYNRSEYEWKERQISLSDVKKVVYDGVTIWEAENAKN